MVWLAFSASSKSVRMFVQISRRCISALLPELAYWDFRNGLDALPWKQPAPRAVSVLHAVCLPRAPCSIIPIISYRYVWARPRIYVSQSSSISLLPSWVTACHSTVLLLTEMYSAICMLRKSLRRPRRYVPDLISYRAIIVWAELQ
jgi:hypothetical protein